MNVYDILEKEEILNLTTEFERISFENISTDRETVKENELLFIIDGVHEDLSKELTVKATPSLIVASNGRKIKADSPIIRVESARRSLSFAFFRLYNLDKSNMKYVAVTGTNGKTTTATMIREILTRAEKRVGFIGTGKIMITDKEIQNEGYSMTTPDPRMLYEVLSKMEKEKVEYVIMEVSSHALSLCKVAPIRFEVGIFTNLTHEHTDFHTDMENYYQCKRSLFNQCDKAIINVDDPYGRRLYTEIRNEKISVGAVYGADAYATDIEALGLSGVNFTYRSKRPVFRVKMKLAGLFNVYNAALAICCSVEIGIRPYIARDTLNSLQTVKGRMEKICEAPTVFIDYAHTPYAFQNSLISLKSALNLRQSITVVFGCGGNRDTEKREKMGEIAEKYADRIIITEDNSRCEDFQKIAEQILEGIKKKEKATIIPKRSDAVKQAILSASNNDVVLISGKGEESYIIDKDGTHSYSEYSSVMLALKEREECRL